MNNRTRVNFTSVLTNPAPPPPSITNASPIFARLIAAQARVMAARFLPIVDAPAVRDALQVISEAYTEFVNTVCAAAQSGASWPQLVGDYGPDASLTMSGHGLHYFRVRQRMLGPIGTVEPDKKLTVRTREGGELQMTFYALKDYNAINRIAGSTAVFWLANRAFANAPLKPVVLLTMHEVIGGDGKKVRCFSL